MYSPYHTSLFQAIQQRCRRPASYPQVHGACHTCSIELIAAALAQERSVGRGAGSFSLGSRKAVAPEMDNILWLIDFRTRRHRIEPSGGRRVKGGAAKEQKCYEHGAQADEALLRTEGAVPLKALVRTQKRRFQLMFLAEKRAIRFSYVSFLYSIFFLRFSSTPE